jgi:hypothetical protein
MKIVFGARPMYVWFLWSKPDRTASLTARALASDRPQQFSCIGRITMPEVFVMWRVRSLPPMNSNVMYGQFVRGGATK